MTAYLTANVTAPDQIPQQTPLAFIHGYHVAFYWGAALFGAALLSTFALGCETVEGVGEDVEELGDEIEDAADDARR